MHSGARANLFLNDIAVGDVVMQGSEDSWAHGEFAPSAAFAQFAEAFGRWSLLMHADAHDEKLSEAAGDELREVEVELQRFRAKLFFPETGDWVECAQVNIDGPLIEWKQY